MHVRSEEELINRLSESSKNRKQELINLESLIKNGQKKHLLIARRSSVVLSYAHWEGFVKDASIAYVEYVSFQSPVFSSLTDNFQAIICRNLLQDAAKATKKIQPHLEVVRQFTDFHSQKVKIDSQTAIDTESNLNWNVFENICKTIGIDCLTRWSSYGHFINDFVESRCAIAHGELFPKPDEKFAEEVIKFVIDAIDWYKTDIENAAIMKLYLRKKPDN